MFVENLLGDITKLRKPIIQDSVYWGVGSELVTGREVTFIPNTEHSTKLKELQNDQQTIYWSIENKENSQYIGNTSVYANTPKQSEIHILLSNPNYKGKEISIEVISLVLNYLKYKAKISEVIINIEQKNQIMIKVLETIGFNLKSSSDNILTYHTIV
ncbi:GNAT family N-acetyltransferase [Candidatus Gracilibacteria bacterium]|nr:GNAT family N-acetyltransferase [Candidatus Gracilibacteria bacterium]NJS41003.1 GNAT family N-acetyltransferase [Candidatus Gracilibacteria bacterium]